MEKIFDKLKENIDTRFCCCNCNKKFCIAWKILKVIFFLFKYFFLCSYLIYFSNKNSNYYDEIIDNWSSLPIKNIERLAGRDIEYNNIGLLNSVKKNYYIHSLYGVQLKFVYAYDYDFDLAVDNHGHSFYGNNKKYVVSLAIIDENNLKGKYYDEKIYLKENKYLVYNLGTYGFYVQSKFTAT